jgi:transposase
MCSSIRQFFEQKLSTYFRTRQGAAHINGIESFWSFAKSRLHQFAGVPKHTFLLHLKECKFRFHYRYQDLYKVLLKELHQHHLNSNSAS